MTTHEKKMVAAVVVLLVAYLFVAQALTDAALKATPAYIECREAGHSFDVCLLGHR